MTDEELIARLRLYGSKFHHEFGHNDAADRIDRAPKADARELAQRARACIEDAVEQVIRHVGRAVGAGPYCQDPHMAQLMADLPVYVRQSHAERDLAALGEWVAGQSNERWQL